MKIDIRYYLVVLLRHLHYIFIVFTAVTAISGILAFKLPAVYESSARLLMEAPQIPDALASSTVDTAALEQLQIIEQRLMTRQNLLEIARKFKALPKIDTMDPDAIVEAMRGNTTITKQAGRDQATLMNITFDAAQGQIAAAVVNEYVTRLLADNTGIRTSQAQDTLQFFHQQVDRLSTDLSTQSAKILEFQNKNADALPDTLNYRLTQQSNFQERIASLDREVAGLKDQRQRLIDIYRATGQLDGSPQGTTLSPEAQQLAALELELTQALAVYAAGNPKVKLLQSKVAELKAKASAVAKAASLDAQTQAPPQAEGTPPDPAAPAGSENPADPAAAPDPMSPLDIQTADIDAQISQLTTQRDDTSKALAALTETINRTAGVAVQLEALRRDYANIQTQYDTTSDQLAKASTGERIEALSKGQRIAVLDAATVPDAPTRPNRVKIIIFGAALGLMLGLGLVGLLEVLNRSVRRSSDLERHLNITPIGSIPYVRTPAENLRLRLSIVVVLVLIVAGLPALLYLVDTYYMPVDLIMAKISTKLGL